MSSAGLLMKLFLAILAFPPIYIVAKYLGWCSKQEREQIEKEEEES